MKRTRPCDKCGGTGQVRNDEYYGQLMRKKREAAGVGLREMARRLDLSAAYLSDLELGRRHWSDENVSRYEKLKEKQ